ncbi:polysaccharide lyase family 8 super-sandwich domain-containing protein [Tamlana sp. 2201CG12-4]|uniref:polysaccharide lyase family 8 super-sandwich domain-containing protein n=1 Tax=Tamlana sp. 2201CG12-4 TaxID=3112582 RepID=UPI002DBCABD0|nr:polysaccharide lyase family 8 super-sandwich domain-containing protein [Tamlana sp. 2201CG12-4]MEC3908800.1 polysaccharide lyase family 8 super-sandwich domain-containing protein [Tamlana sp. 2201CG12-4]
MKCLKLVVLVFLITGSSMAQTAELEKLERLFEEVANKCIEGEPFLVRTTGKNPESVLINIDYNKILEDINDDGSYKSGLEKVDVNPEVLKSKILPHPDNIEADKYMEHHRFLRKLYALSCKWRQEGMKNNLLSKRVINGLTWYMNNYVPERPYWRVTMRFGVYEAKRLGTPILAELDRTLMNLLPLYYKEKKQGNYVLRELMTRISDYTDHLIEPAVGAQNRGVNWQSRFNQIIVHYLVKYKLYGIMALNQMKYHFYDGFEYDPGNDYAGGMGTLTDGGFWHHNKQPYCLPYGHGDYEGSVTLLKLLEGTPVEFKKVHYKTYEEQLIKKWQYVIYNKEWFDLAIVGGKHACQLKKGKARVQPETLLKQIDQVLTLDKDTMNYYDEIIALRERVKNGTHDKALSANVLYWNWEYMLHRRPGWYIGYRGLSKKTVTSEWDQNFHLSSGHTAILQRGDEYWNVRPALRWTALPGITAEQLPYTDLLNKNSNGDSGFCNGSSDGKFGVFAFDMEHANTKVGTVKAKKAAFFFNEGVVGLTTSIERISAGKNKEVWTSLDNRELKGDVVAYINGVKMIFKEKDLPHNKSFKLNKTSWVWHDGIGYVIPVKKGENKTIKLLVENRSGKVADVLPHNNKEKFSHNTFLLTINHGKNPEKDKAQYMAFPSVTLNDMNEKLVSKYAIVKNTEAIQLVHDKEKQIAAFAFRKAGKINIPEFGEIESFGPIIGTMRKQGGKLIVSLSNPYKNKLSNDVTLAGNAAFQIGFSGNISGKNAAYIEDNKQSIIAIPASSERGYEGESMVYEFKIL